MPVLGRRTEPHYASVALATDVTHGCSGASRQRCGSSTRSLSTRPTLSSSRATFPPRRRKLISTAPKASGNSSSSSSSKQVSKVAQHGGIVELSEGSQMYDSIRLLYLLTYLLTKATGSPLTGTTRSPRRSSGATACGVAWRWARLEPGDGRACRPSWSSTRRERRWRFCRPNERAPARLPGSRASGGAGPRSCDEATRPRHDALATKLIASVLTCTDASRLSRHLQRVSRHMHQYEVRIRPHMSESRDTSA